MMFKQLNIGARFTLLVGGLQSGPVHVKIFPWEFVPERHILKIGSRHAKVELQPKLPKAKPARHSLGEGGSPARDLNL